MILTRRILTRRGSIEVPREGVMEVQRPVYNIIFLEGTVNIFSLTRIRGSVEDRENWNRKRYYEYIYRCVHVCVCVLQRR